MVNVVMRSPWKIWVDVIFALFAREIKTSFDDKFGISWAVIQPILFILVLSFLRGRLDGGETHTMPTFVFMAYGLLLIQLFLQTFQSVFTSIKKNKPLYAFRQVQPISSAIASAVFEILVKVFVFAGISTVMYFLNMEIRIDNPLVVILCIFGLWIIAFSLGLLLGVSAFYIPEINKMQSMLTRPLFFISGVFFSLKDIPKDYWWLFDWNPILHAIELSRGAAYGSYGAVSVNLEYFCILMICLLFVSLSVYTVYWKNAISR